MRETNKERLSYKESYNFLEKIISDSNNPIKIDKVHHSIFLYDKESDNEVEFKLPLLFPEIKEKEDLLSYFNRIPIKQEPYLIILIRAGNSALAYFDYDAKLIHHKVIRKYMVRKKQGKAQITHLKTKGKSRLGSRIRLQQTIQFFEEINEKLNEWEIIKTKNIFYACPVRLWGYVFKSKVKTPFQKDDNRLIKIPLTIRTPNSKELKKVNYHIQSGFIMK